MDRHRGERGGDRGGGDGAGRHSRMPSRWSSGSPTGQHNRYPGHSRGGEGFSGGGGRHHPYRHPNDYPPPGGGPGFRGGTGGGFGGSMPPYGPRRGGGGFPGRGGSPDFPERSNFAKLFIGSVPRTATEEEIRPLFEEHGEVIEVALIKDKRTGQQQGCCFIKYASSEEADRAIRALHNQYTLPGGTGPIQVRYADGERERLGAVEHKLFVGSLNKQATEKEVEDIFSPYGHVEDVYLMRDDLKQSRGCGFVKFSSREMALEAMTALNGTYIMRGCDQPLIVRFADPKKPRAGEARPAFGGPGFGPRSQAPVGIRPGPNFGEPMGGRMPPNAWNPMGPQSVGPSSQVNTDGFGGTMSGKGGGISMPSAGPDSLGGLGGTMNGSLSSLAAKPSASQQVFNSSLAQAQSAGQQLSPAQKPITPQQLPSALQLQHAQQNMVSQPQSQSQTLQLPAQQLGQIQIPQSMGLPSSQPVPGQHLLGIGGQLPTSHSSVQQNASATALQAPLSLQQQAISGAATQQLPASSVSQLLQQPIQQLPSQISQALLQQQAQALQMSFQSSQQAISQLQQQLQLMQQSNISQQQSSQTAKQQPQWTGVAPQSATSTATSAPAPIMPSAASATPSLPVAAQSAAPLTCNWTEHTSPQGYKYYYNSVSRESKWEKPDELTLFEQQQQQQKLLLLQQQQQKLAVQQLQSPSQAQSLAQIQPSQSVSQMQQVQPQMQLSQQGHMQLLQPSLAYQASGAPGQPNVQDYNYGQLQKPTSVVDQARVQQGIQAAQEWMWKNKPPGS